MENNKIKSGTPEFDKAMCDLIESMATGCAYRAIGSTSGNVALRELGHNMVLEAKQKIASLIDES